MTTMTEVAPIDDPAVRASLAAMYVKESRDRRRYGPPETRDGRALRIAANWEGVRNRLAYLVAIDVVKPDGSVRSSSVFAREFIAAQIMDKRATDRWRTAYQASKSANA